MNEITVKGDGLPEEPKKPTRQESAPDESGFNPEALFYEPGKKPNSKARIDRLKRILKNKLQTVDDVLDCLTWVARAAMTRNMDVKIVNAVTSLCNAALQGIKLKGGPNGVSSVKVRMGASDGSGKKVVKEISIEKASPKQIERLVKDVAEGDVYVVPDDE